MANLNIFVKKKEESGHPCVCQIEERNLTMLAIEKVAWFYSQLVIANMLSIPMGEALV